MIPTPYKIIALLLALISMAGLSLLYGHFQYARGVRITTAIYETAIAKQKNAAAQQLLEVTRQVDVKEQTLQSVKNNQDIKDVQHTQTISNLSIRLRDALNSSSGLCGIADTGCRTSGNCTNNTATGNAFIGANNTTAGSGVFPADFADVLERLTLNADAINNAYAACRSDAISIREILK